MAYYDRDKAPNNGGTTNIIGGNLGWPQAHISHAPEFQVSGFPFVYTLENDSDGNGTDFVDNTIFKIDFPQVTRWLLVSAHKTNDKADHGSCHVAFHENGFAEGTFADTRFFDTQRLELKCSSIWVRFTVSSKIDHLEVIAGLTNISRNQFSNYQSMPNASSGGTNIPGLNVLPTVTAIAP